MVELRRIQVVLAMGPVTHQAFRVLTGGSVQFGSGPGQKPNPLLWLPVFTLPVHRTPGYLDRLEPDCGSKLLGPASFATIK